MRSFTENGTLTLVLEGRIDTTNAPEFEKEALDALAANAGMAVVLDADGLAYISSAGLRVLMKLRKQAGAGLTVRNVSPEVYEIFETTGFTELLEVKKRLREISVEGCELIGSGGYGKVYRIDPETIVKIYSPGISLAFVEQERATSQRAFLMGVPTAISYDVVKCGESYGVVYHGPAHRRRPQAHPGGLREGRHALKGAAPDRPRPQRRPAGPQGKAARLAGQPRRVPHGGGAGKDQGLHPRHSGPEHLPPRRFQLQEHHGPRRGVPAHRHRGRRRRPPGL